MPRHARLLLPGYPHHIIQRSHNRQPCFLQRSDYSHYLEWLDEFGRTYDASIHAYVLMTNHVHLLASIEDVVQLPILMKNIAQNYAQYLNRRCGRSGSVWQGRYYSSPVTTDRYFLTCQRYIELNPVRASMVDAPSRYRWSSYSGNAGLLADELLIPHTTYLSLNAHASKRYEAYRGLFADAISPGDLHLIRRAVTGNRPL
ncbi:transposase [Pseudoduganella lutea]|uniref:Transposase n=1 Tax=Pseudoduganella lutea TaxID=321985 RepID=A0A4P6L120_9BURK|nr:transposase [Pseudoduganella lutea]QBE65196.1 transposase [Pseudoduganella lutea]